MTNPSRPRQSEAMSVGPGMLSYPTMNQEGETVAEKRQCLGCGQDVTVNPSGSLRKHHDPNRNGFVCDGSPAPTPATDRCEACGQDVTLTIEGDLDWHLAANGEACVGSPSLQPLTNDPAPAPFSGDTEGQDCPACGHWVYGSACTEDGCGWETSWTDPAPVPTTWAASGLDPVSQVARQFPDGLVAETVKILDGREPAPSPGDLEASLDVLGVASSESMPSEADTFLTPPAPSAPKPSDPDAAMAFLASDDQVAYTNASGQPRERTNRSGYLITDPVTGEFQRYKKGTIKGFTRCTTLVKSASDTASLTDWKQRNTLIGAAKRPDIAARAHGLTHEEHRDELNEIVDTLDEIAGAKVAAGQGTEYHEYTERLDSGQLQVDKAPPYWRLMLSEYQSALRAADFQPVPGLIERTTMTHRFGGVAGTFDRVLYHVPTGTYVMGDQKSGKGALDYGRQEIPAQLAVYTDGANRYGIYDWNTDTWGPLIGLDGEPIYVRTDWGVMVHTPIQGDRAFTVELYPVDLTLGRRVAQQCYEIRRDRSAAPAFKAITPGFFTPTFDTYLTRFGAVSSEAEASVLWQEARRNGISGAELSRLVGLAQEVLSR